MTANTNDDHDYETDRTNLDFDRDEEDTLYDAYLMLRYNGHTGIAADLLTVIDNETGYNRETVTAFYTENVADSE